MLKLSYSTNGITNIKFIDAVNEIESAGFDGVEISFQKNQFNPTTLTDQDLLKIKNHFLKSKIKPVAISTGTTFFLSDEAPHDPSLIDLDDKGRKDRIKLIKKGIEIAKKIGVPIVSLQSGYLRENNAKGIIKAQNLLIDSIKECLHDIGDITLVIEPEPGMFIESITDGINIVKEINSPAFKLHLDIGHAYCTETNYVESINLAMPYVRYVHLADIKPGHNLKLISYNSIKDFSISDIQLINEDGYLAFFKNEESFLFLQGKISLYFSNQSKEEFLKACKELQLTKCIDLNEISSIKIDDDKEREVKAYIDSIPKMPLEILSQFIPVLRYLITYKKPNNSLLIDKPICNTTKGMVHYHEFPGKGGINFSAVFDVFKKNRYEGYITVELYNHVDVWQKVLPGSFNFLRPLK